MNMVSHSSKWVVILITTLSVPFVCLGPVHAQEEVIPLLIGEVRVGDGYLTEGYVLLHQVSTESSGEIDSVRVNPDGSFQLRLPHVPDHATRPEIYFASVDFRGLLYFGPAVTEAVQMDSLYLIQAYDTVSVPVGGVQIPLSARNLFLEPAEDGWTATDVFQLNQEGDRTLFSPEEGVVWSYPLPETAFDFQVGQSDFAPDAIRFSNGRVEVYSPLPPGERLMMIGYRIPDLGFSLPMPGTTVQMEVLIREPAPEVEFHPLSLSEPMEIEGGSSFRRYAGEDLVDVEIQGEVAPEPWSLPPEWLGVFLAGLLGVAGVVGYRRRHAPTPVNNEHSESLARDQLLLAIAELDAEFQAEGDTSEKGQIRYGAERKKLLSLLKRRS